MDSAKALVDSGFVANVCWIDLGETAVDDVKKELQTQNYNGVVIGAGIRVPASNFSLFEKLVNTITEFSPGSKIIFNTKPQDTVTAVQRWF
jgi:hypothetical protein